MSEKEDFLKALQTFEAKHEFVMQISRAVGIKHPDPRRRWANLLFHRLWKAGCSVLMLCDFERRNLQQSEISLLDHASVAALVRNILEVSAMFAYLSDLGISEPEWNLRRLVLELHDTTARCKFLKHIGDTKTEEATEFRTKIDTLRTTIKSDAQFQALNAENQHKLLSGMALYINGLRGVVREAGWDADHFDAMYVALSNYAHGAPMSFYRSVSEPDEPAAGITPDYQYAVAGLSLEYATDLLDFACRRMFNFYPERFLKDETKH
jgi:hypothetical protein